MPLLTMVLRKVLPMQKVIKWSGCAGTITETSTPRWAAKNDFNETLKDCSQMLPGDYKKIKAHIRLLGRLFRIFAPLF